MKKKNQFIETELYFLHQKLKLTTFLQFISKRERKQLVNI